MMDEDLAQRTCALVGYRVLEERSRGVYCIPIIAGCEFPPQLVSWPDLSEVALKHVEAKGWRLYVQAVHGGIRANLGRGDVPHVEWYGVTIQGPASTALYRAICAACCATEDSQWHRLAQRRVA